MFVDLLGSKGCNMGGQPALLTILNIHKTGTNRAQPGQARYPLGASTVPIFQWLATISQWYGFIKNKYSSKGWHFIHEVSALNPNIHYYCLGVVNKWHCQRLTTRNSNKRQYQAIDFYFKYFRNLRFRNLRFENKNTDIGNSCRRNRTYCLLLWG